MEARIIPLWLWREKIAPMWDVLPREIPVVNNPFRVIRYDLLEARDNICFFPVEYREEGEVKGYNAIYNVSDRVIRFRGIYVLPEHRGHGVGHRMCDATMALFPPSFHRVIGFYKEAGVQRFLDHGGMKEAPIEPLWSEFSETNLRVLYRDRQWKPDSKELAINKMFLEHHWPQYGYGGDNNMKRTWTDEEWVSFANGDFYHYPDVGLKLDW